MKPVTLRLEPWEYEFLRRLAFERRESANKIVRDLIQQEMERLGALNRRLSRDDFAQFLGFPDSEALGRASEEIIREGDVSWYVTRLQDGRWVAWDDAELTLDRIACFRTRDDAVRYQKGGVPS